MQNSMVVFTFFVFKGKYPFQANLVQKIKIITLSRNLVAALIRICRIQWRSLLFSFSNINTLFGQIWSKNQNFQFKAKLATQTNSNMQNSMAVFTFFIFNQNCQYLQFKVKFDTQTNSIIHNSMAVFTFFVLDQKQSFWTNLVQNVKIVSLRLNSVDILILICRIH